MVILAVVLVGLTAGAVASVAGFGIGSLLTPLGTLIGERVLRRLPEKLFRPVVSAIILALGCYEFYVFFNAT